MGDNNPFSQMSDAEAASWLSAEYFRRAAGGDVSVGLLEQLCTDLLDILRCPCCGGRLGLVTSLFHRSTDDHDYRRHSGLSVLRLPVVDGIPVLHLQPSAVSARELSRPGRRRWRFAR